MTTTDRKVTITEVIVEFTGGTSLRHTGSWDTKGLSIKFPICASDGSDMLLNDVPTNWRDSAFIRFVDQNGRTLHSDPRIFVEDIADHFRS